MQECGFGEHCDFGKNEFLGRQSGCWHEAAGAGLQDKTPVVAFLLCALGGAPSGGGQLSYSHS